MSDQPPNQTSLPVIDDFDPAGQALSDALRKSFAVLKWLMAIVLILYACSGVFRVRPGEVGYVLRMGRIVGGDGGELREGWHVSWPFPIDEARTMSLAGERAVRASFMYERDQDDRARGGKMIGGSAILRPGRDSYLLTGDVSILHAELIAQYRITSAIAYLTNLYDEDGDPQTPPEGPLLTDLLSQAAIETAAGRGVDDVYKDRSGFLDAVRNRLNQRLDALRDAGRPTGLTVLRVITTSFDGYEAIIPPLHVIPDFEAVQSAEQKKGQLISEAAGKSQAMLNAAAGPVHAELAAAIEAEYAAQVKQSDDLPKLRKATEDLLRGASGAVREILKSAESQRDRLVSEAQGDANLVRSLSAEYVAAPALLMERLRLTKRQEMLDRPTVNKKVVPPDVRDFWIQIKRDALEQEKAARERDAFERDESGDEKRPAIGTPGKLRAIKPERVG